MYLTRRSLLALPAVISCPICVRALAADTHWGYSGAIGPTHWAELSADFRSCRFGTAQSPIDLRNAAVKPGSPPEITFQSMQPKVVNNGHTIQLNCPAGSSTKIDGTDYDLIQFHFHHPSEHLLVDKRFAMECHFVCRASTGKYAVIGVFVSQGRANAVLAPIWAVMPKTEGPEQPLGATIYPGRLLPRDQHYFRYTGSLTTPPCSEGITWIVFRTPIEASAQQINHFAALFPMNARPVQRLDRRTVQLSG